MCHSKIVTYIAIAFPKTGILLILSNAKMKLVVAEMNKVLLGNDIRGKLYFNFQKYLENYRSKITVTNKSDEGMNTTAM